MGSQLGERSLLGGGLPELGAGWRLPRVLPAEGCSLCLVLALVFWPLPFQPLVQVFHLLLLQTLWEESGNGASGPGAGHPLERS